VTPDEEEQRHRCEVRQWLRWRAGRGASGKEWLASVLEDIGKRRGRDAAERLKRDIAAQWKSGNRGEPGAWFDDAEAAPAQPGRIATVAR
jgi:hypothetical protein